MSTKRFAKGQVVYYASANFSRNAAPREGVVDPSLGVVIERVVDACGTKQITFFNRGGLDCVFGRSKSASSPNICSTPEEAFAYLRAQPRVTEICPVVYSDSNKECFDDLYSGAMVRELP